MRPTRQTRPQRLVRTQGTEFVVNSVAYQTPYKKAKRPQVIVFPENISDKYASKIQSFFQTAIDNITTLLSDFQKKYLDDDFQKDSKKLLKQIQKEVDSIEISVTESKPIVEDIQTKIVANNDLQYNQSIKSSIGVVVIPPDEYLKPLLKKWSKENSDLIVTIQGDMKIFTQKLIEQYTTAGMSVTELTDSIEKLTRLPKWKAERIARTETNKLFTQMSRNKSEGIGVKRYIWRSAGDAAVRDQHARNNGKVFNYETGDEEGSNPGSQINCRCTDIPYFHDLLR